MIPRTRFIIILIVSVLASQPLSGVTVAPLTPQTAPTSFTLCDGLVAPDHLAPADSVVLNSTSVTIQWSAIHNVNGYALYFWDETAPNLEDYEGAVFTTAPGGSTSYTVNNLKPGHWYRWTVRGIQNGCGYGVTQSSSLFGVSQAQPPIPPMPYRLNATRGTQLGFVSLYWLASSYDESYWIYRTDPTNGIPVQIATIQSLPFEDHTGQPGKHYIYTVKACSSSGCSIASQSAEGWSAGSCPALRAPTNLQPASGSQDFVARDGGDWAVLEWSGQPGLTRFNVQVYRQDNGSLVEDTEVEDSLLNYYTPGDYSWRVRSYSPVAGCAPGPWSRVQAIHIHWYPAPLPPVNLQASDGVGDTLLVSWEPSPPNELGYTSSTYLLYRAEDPNGAWTVLADTVYGETYEDQAVQSGKTYYYRVSGCTEYGGCGDPSNADDGYAGQIQSNEQGSAIFLPMVGR